MNGNLKAIKLSTSLQGLLVFLCILFSGSRAIGQPNNPTSFSVDCASANEIQLSWTRPTGVFGTDWDGVIVYAREGSATVGQTFTSEDIPGSDGNGVFGAGDAADNSAFVVAIVDTDVDGDVVISGLTAGSTYHFIAYAYDEITGANNDDFSTGTSIENGTANGITGASVTTNGSGQVTINWTNPSPATCVERVVIVARSGSAVEAAVNQANLNLETDATNYVAAASWSARTDANDVRDITPSNVGTDNTNYVVANVSNATNSAVITGLDSETNFHFRVFLMGSGSNASVSEGVDVNAFTFSSAPAAHPAAFSATTAGSDQIDLNFSDAGSITNADGYIILRRMDGSNPTASGVVDGNAPGSLSLPAGTTLVTTITNGTTTSFSNTGLNAETSYNYAIIPFNSDGSNDETFNYRTSATIQVDDAFTLSDEPAAHPAAFTATPNGSTQVDLSFSAASTITDADGYIILRRQDGSNPTASGIVDGSNPGSLSLPAGTTLVTTITNGATTSFPNTGLTAGTSYNYAIIPFNFDGSNNETYNYRTSATIQTASSSTGITVTIGNNTSNTASNAAALENDDTNLALLGFSLTSDGTPSLTGINIQASSNPPVSITNIRLFISTDNTFSLADTDLGATVNLTASEIQISGISQTVSSSVRFYFLVADIAGTVNSSTPNLQLSFDQNDLSIGGSVTANTITGRDYSFADVINPVATAFSPMDNATNVPASTNLLQITFDEDVVIDPPPIIDDTDRIRIRIGSTTVRSIDKDDPAVTTSGNVATIDLSALSPSFSLSANTSYNIRIGGDVFEDTENPEGNNYAGIASSTTWNFTTTGSSVTAANLDVCQNTGFVPLGDIRINEGSDDDFSDTNTTVSLILSLSNTGFSFQPGVGTIDVDPSPPGTGSNDIDNINISVGAQDLLITYTMDNNGNGDQESIVISGLMVQANGSQASASLLRTGGTANQSGNAVSDANVHAALTLGTPAITFTNDATANTICEGEAIIFTVGNNTGYTGYNFMVDGVTAQNNGSNQFTTSALTNGQIVSVVATGPAVCSDFDEFTITVNDSPVADINITSGSNPSCVGDDIEFTASPSGADNYTFNRYNSANVFISSVNNGTNPSLTINNTTLNNGDRISVTVTESGCTDESARISQTINSLPSVTLDTDDGLRNYSETAAAVTLVGTPSTPVGVYSGPGVIGDQFFPNIAGITSGTPHTLTYTYTDPSTGCSSSDIILVDVFDPNATFNNLSASYCADDGSEGILSLSPSAPIIPPGFEFVDFVGPGVQFLGGSNYRFVPGLAGDGSHTVSMRIRFSGIPPVIPPGAPIIFISQITTVNPVPDASFEPINFAFCDNEGAVDLTPTNTIESGAVFNFSASQGITGNQTTGFDFDPSLVTVTGAGPEVITITYTYTSPDNCDDVATQTVRVFAQPPAPTAPDVEQCERNVDPFLSVSGQSGAIFTWYTSLGDVGINPAGGGENFDTGLDDTSPPVTNTFYVTQTLNNCESDPTEVDLIIRSTPLPTLALSPTVPAAGYCEDEGVIDIILSPTLGSPSLTTELFFDGQLINTDEFNTDTIPVGAHLLRYRVTNVFNCVDSVEVPFVIQPLPVLSFEGLNAALAYCENDAPVELTANQSGGLFSGNGVVNTGVGTATFNPASPAVTTSGVNTITYTFTEPTTNCSNTITRDITVFPIDPPNFVNITNGLTEFCITDGPVTLQGNQGTLGNYTGPGLTDNMDGTATFDPRDFDTGGDFDISFSYQNANQCSESITQTFTINELPIVSIFGFNNPAVYCVNETPGTVALSSNQTAGTFVGDGITDNGDGTASWNIITAAGSDDPASQSSHDITFTFTDPVTGCTNSITQTVLIDPKPDVSVFGLDPSLAYCKTDSIFSLQGAPGEITGIFVGGTADNAITNGPRGLALFDPGAIGLTPGSDFTIRYEYTNPETSCVNDTVTTISILPNYTLAFNTVNPENCDGDLVEFQSRFTPIPMSAAITLDFFTWDFGDGSAQVMGPSDDPIPAGTNGGRTTGTYRNPIHQFLGTGDFTVTAAARSSTSCDVAQSEVVRIGVIPEIDFQWTNVCVEQPVSFTSIVSNLDKNLDIRLWAWDFDNDGTPDDSSPDPTFTFPAPGVYPITLVAVTNDGCRQVFSEDIFVVPTITFDPDNRTYKEDFDQGTGDWVAGGTSPSWQHGTPTGGRIDFDGSVDGNGQAWKTTNIDGTYNAGENSWVHSPCFDMTGINRPVIQFSLIYSTRTQLDGLVLQVNPTDNTDDESLWEVVGEIDQGRQWYNTFGIQGSPGQQTISGDIGWSGSNNVDTINLSYDTVAFNLDPWANEPRLRFRLAFGSIAAPPSDDFDGVAFDNISIGERTRTVLLENFTNTSLASAVAHNQAYRNFGPSTQEVVRIQYHTSFPGDDPIADDDPFSPNARASFYGITDVPAARVDGSFQDGALDTWLNEAFNNATLLPAELDIDIQTLDTLQDQLFVRATMTALAEIKPNAVVHIAFVEREITAQEAAGTNGETEFDYVVKDMLPSAAGTKFTQAFQEGDQFTAEAFGDINNFYDLSQVAVVVFVQNEDLRTILQASILENPLNVPGVVTDVDDALNSNADITIYPNPANQNFTVVFPEITNEALDIQVIDPVGKLIHQQNIPVGVERIEIDSEDFAAGLYHITISNKQEIISRKRLMIMHQ
ncbi:MAG: PKD domain-containing protein [Bacteroidota bacterium]